MHIDRTEYLANVFFTFVAMSSRSIFLSNIVEPQSPQGRLAFQTKSIIYLSINPYFYIILQKEFFIYSMITIDSHEIYLLIYRAYMSAM